MILHGISKTEEDPFFDDECLDEILEVRKMPETIKKHEKMVVLNPNDYNSWNYLKKTFLHSKSFEDTESQLLLTQKAIEANPKSYATWHHRYMFFRKLLSENLHFNSGEPNGNASTLAGTEERLRRIKQEALLNEQKLCLLLLKFDPRNFHCWNYCLKNSFRFKLDLHNPTSIHFREFNEEYIFIDPNEESVWRSYEKRKLKNLKGYLGCLKEYPEKVEILFENVFQGNLVIFEEEVQVTDPTKRIVLEKPGKWADLAKKPIKIQNRLCRTNEGHKTQASKQKNNLDAISKIECRNFEPIEAFFKEEKNDDILDKVLLLEPNCIFALKKKMLYLTDLDERKKISDKLQDIDPNRKKYYKVLENDVYRLYNIIAPGI